jgi:hypothetical protein
MAVAFLLTPVCVDVGGNAAGNYGGDAARVSAIFADGNNVGFRNWSSPIMIRVVIAALRVTVS